MKKFVDLIVWQKSHAFVLKIYKILEFFPPEEKYGLSQQMRRAAVSIPANIAEGSKRKTDKNYSYFLNISEGSLEEIKNYIILSKDLKYINLNTYKSLLSDSEEIGKLLSGFIKRLKNNSNL